MFDYNDMYSWQLTLFLKAFNAENSCGYIFVSPHFIEHNGIKAFTKLITVPSLSNKNGIKNIFI